MPYKSIKDVKPDVIPLYLRFVTSETDADSHVSQGVFQAAYALRDAGTLEEQEAIWFSDVVGWFGKNLRAPSRSDFSLPYYSFEFNRVIFWLKGTAHEHIQRMQQVAAMLRYHRVPVRVLRTSRPGSVVYEDKYQVGPSRSATGSPRRRTRLPASASAERVAQVPPGGQRAGSAGSGRNERSEWSPAAAGSSPVARPTTRPRIAWSGGRSNFPTDRHPAEAYLAGQSHWSMASGSAGSPRLREGHYTATAPRVDLQPHGPQHPSLVSMVGSRPDHPYQRPGGRALLPTLGRWCH